MIVRNVIILRIGVLSMEMAKVTSKGQITIPVSIRRRLGINEGDKLLFINSPDGVVMVNPDMLPAGQDVDSLREAENDVPVRTAVTRGTGAGTEKAAADAQGAGQESRAATPGYSSAPTAPRASDSGTAGGTSAPVSPSKPGQQVRGLDIGALLDEIRSIGSSTLK